MLSQRCKKKTRGRPATNSKQQNKPDLPHAQPPLHRREPPRHSSYAPTREREFDQQLRRHCSVRKTPSGWDSENIHGYDSGNIYNETPFYQPVDPPTQRTYFRVPSPSDNPNTFWNTFGFTEPGESSTFQNVDAAADPSYFYNPSTRPTYDYGFGVNENTTEETYFTSAPTEYDFLGLNQQNVEDKKSHDYRMYVDQIPKIFIPYVKDIKNVYGDGNCGFRATAYALGYGEHNWLHIRRMLIDEMVEFKEQYTHVFGERDYNDVFHSLSWSGDGFAPAEYWMMLPWTGYLIANKFNVIFHSISKLFNGSSTIFPLWRGPKEFPDKKIITIAFMDNNHFVMVEMQEDFPMGITHNLWHQWKSPAAKKWDRVFRSRQNIYRASLPRQTVQQETETTTD